MKLAFFHDVRLYKDSNGVYYTSSSFGHEVWTRYLSVFDELIVVSRSELLTDEQRLVCVSRVTE